MSRTVIGLFDEFSQAEAATRDLENAGIPHSNISIVASNANNEYTNWRDNYGTDYGTPPAGQGANIGATAGGIGGVLLGLGLLAIPGLGPLAAAGPLVAGLTGAGVGAATGAVTGGLIGALTDQGVPEEHAGYFSEGIRRGGTLVSVSSADNLVDQVIAILNRRGAVDINQRADYYRQTGYAGYNATAQPYTASELAAERERIRSASTAAAPVAATTMQNTLSATNVNIPQNVNQNIDTNINRNINNVNNNVNAQGETVLPVIEENLSVGKREVQGGGVRVYTHLTEKPVEASVNLREEHVTVDRRPVNRPVGEADFAAFKEGTIEVMETSEIPVVAKEARIVEEVVVGKEATQRTETVRDTVRRTDVEVEQIAGQTTATGTTLNTTGTTVGNAVGHTARDLADNAAGAAERTEGSIPGVQTGGRAVDGSDAPDTRGITEKIADTVTGNRVDDKTGRPV
jgi:uncharacterized protein (TIGR02271 family)